MGKYKIYVILLALFLVVGADCNLRGGSSSGIEEDDFTGSQGLVLKVIEGMPPENIWKGVDFSIWLEVQNKGVNDVSDGNICIGSLPNNIFTKSDSCQSLEKMMGRRNFPGGQVQVYGEDYWDGFGVKDSYKVNVDTRYPFSAKTCYQYSTSLSPLACVRDLRKDIEAVCEAGVLETGSNQGGPVAVTYLKEDIVPRGNMNELFFTLKVENVGDGEVTKTNEKDKECDFERKQKDLVKISVDMPGFGKADCKNKGEIPLVNGEGQAFCSGIKVPQGESFSLPLNIRLDYGYLSRIRGEFMIKKDIMEEK